MITNNSLTVYHKILDEETRLEKWIRFNYDNVWIFGGKGAGINKGYENANDVQIRIPYDVNKDLSINNFDIGDILLPGSSLEDIETQEDLQGKIFYNITSMNDNNYGLNKHIHLGGK